MATFMSILNAETTDVKTYLFQQCQENKQAMAEQVRYMYNSFANKLSEWEKDIQKAFLLVKSLCQGP